MMKKFLDLWSGGMQLPAQYRAILEQKRAERRLQKMFNIKDFKDKVDLLNKVMEKLETP